MERLILFDVDGTLISGGPAKEAFRLALVEVFGTAGPIRDWEFSGKTDPQIARELLEEAGVPADRIRRGMPELWRRYLEALEVRIPSDPPALLPGVRDLLAALAERAGVATGLLTGNVAGGAALKLAPVGLGSHFPVGAFGSDHEIRNRLPRIAVGRARERWGVEFRNEDVVVVGDTPLDVECGRSHGARTIAVATGRFDRDALIRTGPDAVLNDLGATEEALEALLP